MKKPGVLSIGLGIFPLIACELPWLLALSEFTVLGFRLTVFFIDILLVAVGTFFAGFALWFYRRRTSKIKP